MIGDFGGADCAAVLEEIFDQISRLAIIAQGAMTISAIGGQSTEWGLLERGGPMANLNCPRCGAKFNQEDQRKSTDHWFRSGSCPKCKEGVLELHRPTLSRIEGLFLILAVVAACGIAWICRSYQSVEWSGSAILLCCLATSLAFFVPVYLIGRTFFSGSR
jgi:hypothetical protein